MKKLLFILLISSLLYACKTTKVSATPSTKAAADTALQGDSMKNPVKP